MAERAPFAGGDQSYLRDVQYGDGSKLDIRVQLHRRFSTATQQFPDFAAGLIDWSDSLDVLECGCGTGAFWDNRLVPKSVSLTLTDLSPGMVAEAVAHAGAAGFADVAGRECDVQSLPFGDASFDVVLANHMLYHVPDPDRAVAELARVVRPGGVLLAGTNGDGHMGAINDAIAEVFGSHGEGLYAVFGIATGEARLREQFRTVVWHAYDNDLIADDAAHVTAYGLSFPPGEHATQDQRAQFAEAVERRFADGKLRIRTRTGAFVCSNPR